MNCFAVLEPMKNQEITKRANVTPAARRVGRNDAAISDEVWKAKAITTPIIIRGVSDQENIALIASTPNKSRWGTIALNKSMAIGMLGERKKQKAIFTKAKVSVHASHPVILSFRFFQTWLVASPMP